MNDSNHSYVVFRHSTLENLPATHIPDTEAIVGTLSCALAQGKYESVQIGVRASDNALEVGIAVTSDLPVTICHRLDPAIVAELSASDVEAPARHGDGDRRERTAGGLGSGRSLSAGERHGGGLVHGDRSGRGMR